jgi:hypothetical protein
MRRKVQLVLGFTCCLFSAAAAGVILWLIANYDRTWHQHSSPMQLKNRIVDWQIMGLLLLACGVIALATGIGWVRAKERNPPSS